MKQAAELLARWTRLRDVAPADVRILAERGLLRVVDGGEWPLVELDEKFGAVEELRRIGEERRTWWAASMSRWDAAEALGVSLEEFEALAASAGLRPGRCRRYLRTAVISVGRCVGDCRHREDGDDAS